jgi:hypothetical protein
VSNDSGVRAGLVAGLGACGSGAVRIAWGLPFTRREPSVLPVSRDPAAPRQADFHARQARSRVEPDGARARTDRLHVVECDRAPRSPSRSPAAGSRPFRRSSVRSRDAGRGPEPVDNTACSTRPQESWRSSGFESRSSEGRRAEGNYSSLRPRLAARSRRRSSAVESERSSRRPADSVWRFPRYAPPRTA